jgi:hypothetical protein
MSNPSATAPGGLLAKIVALSQKSGLRRLLRHGPFAIAASSLPGAVNYVAILYLTYAFSAQETGAYRLLFSWFALYGLASMYESNKVFIRSIAEDDRSAIGALFATQMTFAVGVFLATLAVWGVARAVGHPIPDGLVWISLISVFFYPTNAYQALYQVRSWFTLFFGTELLKYGVALAVLLSMLHFGFSVMQAVLAQFVCMAAFHVVFFTVSVAGSLDWKALFQNWWSLLFAPASREARSLSLANFLPSTLEHIDKMVIGAVFGLKTLGLYTLGFSTGRFIYNALKPALYIYYKRFVSHMPTARVLLWLGVGFTVFGALLSAVFLVAVAHLPALKPFRGSEMVTVILFLSYGVGMVDAVYLQAYSINKHTNSRHVLIANTIASVACLGLFGAAALLAGPISLALFALHYPLRHGLSVLLVARLRNSSRELSSNVG